MHTPSMITPLLANAVIGEHAQAARTRRATRRQGGRFARRSRRAGAPRSLLPRGQTSPPFAH
jgi:hypothetical protein